VEYLSIREVVLKLSFKEIRMGLKAFERTFCVNSHKLNLEKFKFWTESPSYGSCKNVH